MGRISNTKDDYDPEYVDTVRISAKEWQNLLMRMEAERPSTDDLDRRQSERYRYWNLGGLMVEFEHPGGSVGKFLVQPRDLSEFGISFLHGSFVYQDTVVRLVLVSTLGVQTSVTGTIVRCRHIKGKVHEVGVKFLEAINVEDFATKVTGSKLVDDNSASA